MDCTVLSFFSKLLRKYSLYFLLFHNTVMTQYPSMDSKIEPFFNFSKDFELVFLCSPLNFLLCARKDSLYVYSVHQERF